MTSQACPNLCKTSLKNTHTPKKNKQNLALNTPKATPPPGRIPSCSSRFCLFCVVSSANFCKVSSRFLGIKGPKGWEWWRAKIPQGTEPMETLNPSNNPNRFNDRGIKRHKLQCIRILQYIEYGIENFSFFGVSSRIENLRYSMYYFGSCWRLAIRWGRKNGPLCTWTKMYM